MKQHKQLIGTHERNKSGPYHPINASDIPTPYNHIREMLTETARQGASDLHLTVNAKPLLRIGGRLVPLSDELLTPARTEQLATELFPHSQLDALQTDRSVDMALNIPGAGQI